MTRVCLLTVARIALVAIAAVLSGFQDHLDLLCLTSQVCIALAEFPEQCLKFVENAIYGFVMVRCMFSWGP
jgi:hypothetical protein